jgi:hypothetical protein
MNREQLYFCGQYYVVVKAIWDRVGNGELGTLSAVLNRFTDQGSASYADTTNDLLPGVFAAPAALKLADGFLCT